MYTDGSCQVGVNQSGYSLYVGPSTGRVIVNAGSSGANFIISESASASLSIYGGNQTGAGLTAAADGTIRVTATTASTSSTSGALIVSGGVGIAKDLYVGGITVMGPSAETYVSMAGATGVVVHNFLSGATFYHTSTVANFVPNFTNVPTTGNRVIVVTLVIVQGATAYYPSTGQIQINGSAQTVKWLSGLALSAGNANKVDVISYSLFYSGSAWTVLGQYSNYN